MHQTIVPTGYIYKKIEVENLDFEPPQAEPESDVLPLHHKAICGGKLLGSIVLFPVCGCKVRYFLGIVQIFLPFFLKKNNGLIGLRWFIAGSPISKNVMAVDYHVIWVSKKMLDMVGKFGYVEKNIYFSEFDT